MIIKIKVKTESKKQKIEKVSDKEYKVFLKSRAEDNKANLELLKLLKKEFKKDARIIKGSKSRNKIVEVLD